MGVTMKLNLLVLTILLSSLSTDLWGAQKHRPSGDKQEEANPKRKKEDAATCHICLETEEEDNGTFITPEAFSQLLGCTHRQVHEACLRDALNSNNYCPICRSTGLRQSLHNAASEGNITQVQALLAAGANVNLTDNDGNNPLHYAALNGQLEIVQILLATPEINIFAPNEEGNTAIHCAAFRGHLPVVQILIATLGINVNILNSRRSTPLHCAAYRGHQSVVQALLAAEAAVNITDQFGNTPLHYAAREGHLEVAETLLAAGANNRIKNLAGKTAGQVANTYQMAVLIEQVRWISSCTIL